MCCCRVGNSGVKKIQNPRPQIRILERNKPQTAKTNMAIKRLLENKHILRSDSLTWLAGFGSERYIKFFYIVFSHPEEIPMSPGVKLCSVYRQSYWHYKITIVSPSHTYRRKHILRHNWLLLHPRMKRRYFVSWQLRLPQSQIKAMYILKSLMAFLKLTSNLKTKESSP